MPYTISPSALVSLDQAKIECSIKGPDSSKDDQLTELINTASRAIAGYCEREFTPTASATRRFMIKGEMSWAYYDRVTPRGVDLNPYDLRTASAVTLHPESSSPLLLVAGTDYNLGPLPTVFGTYYLVYLAATLSSVSATMTQFGYALIDVAGAWGFASVPADIERACLVTVGAWYRGEQTVTGGQFTTPGDVVFPETVDSLPRAALRLAKPFKRQA